MNRMIRTDGKSREIGPRRLPKASDLLARDLRQQILSERLVPGSRLLSEAELIETFGASRATVREALRLLEVEGLISVKRGPKGGVLVRAPSEDSVMNALGVLLQFRQVPLAALLEAREVMEPSCAALAAQRASAGDIDALIAATDTMAGVEAGGSAYHAANLEFHVALAAAAHNEVLRIFLTSLRDLAIASAQQMAFSPRQLAYGIRAHRRIIEAIQAKDPEAAREQTLRHVRTFENWADSPAGTQAPILAAEQF